MAAQKDKMAANRKVKSASSTTSLYSRSMRTECGNDVSQLETLLRDMMMCSFCGQVFTDPARLPKALPCTHTYCAVCLASCLHETAVRCPECGSRYEIGGDVNALPNSAMVMRVLSRVCKFCGTMAKLEECAHCRRVSCSGCAKAHLQQVREELAGAVHEIASSTEQLSSKLNLVDAALADVDDKARRVKAELSAESDLLVELVAQRCDRLVDHVEKEVAKERKRLDNVKKALTDTQRTNLDLCAGLNQELEQQVQVLAPRFNQMRNTCAVQLDKVRREHAAVLSLDWDLLLDRPDHNYIRKELEEWRVSKVDKLNKQSPSSGAKAHAAVPSTPAMAHGANGQTGTKNQSFSDHNTSFIRSNAPGKSRPNNKVFL